MISVILIAETNDAAAVETLAALVGAVADGVLRDATLIGPSSDALDRVTDAAGAARITFDGTTRGDDQTRGDTRKIGLDFCGDRRMRADG